MGFGDYLRRHLSDEWGAQRRLAERLGRDRGAVTRWLSNERRPDVASCLEIADALDLDPVEVMREAGVAEKTIAALRRFLPGHQPGGQPLCAVRDAPVHAHLQSLLRRGLRRQVGGLLADLAASMDELAERLAQTLEWAQASGALVRFEGAVIFSAGDTGADAATAHRGPLSITLFGATGQAWERIAEIYLADVASVLRSKGLLA